MPDLLDAICCKDTTVCPSLAGMLDNGMVGKLFGGISQMVPICIFNVLRVYAA